MGSVIHISKNVKTKISCLPSKKKHRKKKVIPLRSAINYARMIEAEKWIDRDLAKPEKNKPVDHDIIDMLRRIAEEEWKSPI
jgi:hypothetical protein